MSKTFTVAEVAKHKTEDAGQYIIVDNGVYDITGKCCAFVVSCIAFLGSLQSYLPAGR